MDLWGDLIFSLSRESRVVTERLEFCPGEPDAHVTRGATLNRKRAKLDAEEFSARPFNLADVCISCSGVKLLKLLIARLPSGGTDCI